MAHKYKLLVIDDEAEILNTIKSYFEKRDFLVETALNGEEGLNKLRNQSFDVALIDLVMPQLSGLDVIKKIFEEDIRVSIAIITGHGDRDEAVQALNLGVEAWFDKSALNMDKLYKSIKDLSHAIPEDKIEKFIAILNEKR